MWDNFSGISRGRPRLPGKTYMGQGNLIAGRNLVTGQGMSYTRAMVWEVYEGFKVED